MDNIAIVVGHIWDDYKIGKGIEIISMANDDYLGTDIFCDIENALLDNINTNGEEDYDFVAIVRAKYIKVEYWEFTEWDTEYEVLQIDNDELQEAIDIYNKEKREEPTMEDFKHES
ncbi:hypothetical protein Thu_120 [Bacillus phage Thurquoise]|nr:hypothetical protein Thu_120 [Bacillus phage Thurquoise]